MTRIAVIGGGRVGGTLGGGWIAAGHEVRFGSRTPEAATDLPGPAGLPADVATWAEVVVITVPGIAAAEVVRGLGAALDGRIVVDATNRSGASPMHNLAVIAAAAPGALPARAFSTIGWEVMADPRFDGEAATLFYAAPAEARDVLDRLASDLGFQPAWLGGPEQADLVDGLTRVWMTLAIRQGLGRHLALRLLRD